MGGHFSSKGQIMALFTSGSPITGSNTSDIIIALSPAANTVDGGASNDLIYGDARGLVTTQGAAQGTGPNLTAQTGWSRDTHADIGQPLGAAANPAWLTAHVAPVAGQFAWYRVTVAAGQRIALDVDYAADSPLGDQDTHLTILTAGGTVLAQSLPGESATNTGLGSIGPRDTELTHQFTTAGTYLIRVGQAANTPFAAAGPGFLMQVSLTGQAAGGPDPAGNDDLTGGAGDDIIHGLGGDDRLFGGQGNDDLFGGAGDNTLRGGDGNDAIRLDGGTDTVFAGAGDDTLDVAADSALVDMGAGNDFARVQSVRGGLYDGGDGDGDRLEIFGVPEYRRFDLAGTTTILRYGVFLGWENLNDTSAHGTTILGTDGANTIEGGRGADDIRGRGGIDTASYINSQAGVLIDLASGIAEGGHAQGDRLTGIESLTGSARADELYGDSGFNRLRGEGGDDNLDGQGGGDILEGGNGDDILWGRAGLDSADGGRGDDTLFGGGGDDLLDGGDGNDLAYGGDGADTVLGINGDDWLFGGAGDDLVLGHQGNDTLEGDAGNDRLGGDEGDDLLIGGAGADNLSGWTGHDTASYATSAAGVTVRLWNATATGGDAQGDVLDQIESLIGSAFGDVLAGTDGGGNSLFGLAGDDDLDGRSGNDTLVGGLGNDLLTGGTGADRLQGDGGTDTANYATSAAGVTVRLWNGTGAGGDAAGDTLAGIENVIGSALTDALIGADAVDNRLTGGAGNDYLDGLSGNDTLDGGTGNDQLVGGAGADVFVFGRLYGFDTVQAFQDGIDRVALAPGLTFANLTLTQGGNGVLVTITGSMEDELLDLRGVTLAQVTAADFI
jgi:Ca2+-binding RTX toxin-like protein